MNDVDALYCKRCGTSMRENVHKKPIMDWLGSAVLVIVSFLMGGLMWITVIMGVGALVFFGLSEMKRKQGDEKSILFAVKGKKIVRWGWILLVGLLLIQFLSFLIVTMQVVTATFKTAKTVFLDFPFKELVKALWEALPFSSS